jgi:chain length determinant protein EpsF
LRARWLLAVTVFGAFLLMAIVLAIIIPRKWTSVASLVIDAKNDPVAANAGVSDAVIASYVNTQADVITSPRVAAMVAKKVRLDQIPYLQRDWQKKTGGQGDIDQWIGNLLLERKWVQAAAPANASTTRQTNVIEISVKWPDPKISADLANGFAEAAIDTNIDLKVEQAKQYSTWFTERSTALRAELLKRQKALSDFQQASGIVATDDKLDVENARLAELSTQLVAVESQRQDAQSRQRQSGDIQNMPEVLASPTIASLKEQLTLSEAKRSEVAGRLGKNHPDYQAAESEVNGLKARINAETEKIVASLGSTAQVSVRREADLRAALEAQKKRVLDLKHDHDRAQDLENDVAATQRDLDAISQRLAQTNLESQTQQTNVVLLTRASVPVEPSSPKLLILIGGGFFLGLVAACGLILILEMLDKRLRVEEDLARMLGVPVLGRVGGSESGRKQSPGKQLAPV